MQSTDQTNADCSGMAESARLACEAEARSQQGQSAAFMGGPQPTGGELEATGDCPGHSKDM